jgi:hypothetical protein
MTKSLCGIKGALKIDNPFSFFKNIYFEFINDIFDCKFFPFLNCFFIDIQLNLLFLFFSIEHRNIINHFFQQFFGQETNRFIGIGIRGLETGFLQN